MLYCAGHSFLQSDIAVFRQNVQALEQLNTRWKLYSRPVFAETLLAEFLTVFLQVFLLISMNLLFVTRFCSSNYFKYAGIGMTLYSVYLNKMSKNQI
jgi:hypothetical protein